MAITTLTAGTLATVRGTFRDDTGALADPTTVTLKVLKPDGTTTTYAAPTHASTGVYEQDVTFADGGDYWLRWESTGAPTVAGEDVVNVLPSRVA